MWFVVMKLMFAFFCILHSLHKTDTFSIGYIASVLKTYVGLHIISFAYKVKVIYWIKILLMWQSVVYGNLQIFFKNLYTRYYDLLTNLRTQILIKQQNVD